MAQRCASVCQVFALGWSSSACWRAVGTAIRHTGQKVGKGERLLMRNLNRPKRCLCLAHGDGRSLLAAGSRADDKTLVHLSVVGVFSEAHTAFLLDRPLQSSL